MTLRYRFSPFVLVAEMAFGVGYSFPLQLVNALGGRGRHALAQARACQMFRSEQDVVLVRSILSIGEHDLLHFTLFISEQLNEASFIADHKALASCRDQKCLVDAVNLFDNLIRRFGLDPLKR